MQNNYTKLMIFPKLHKKVREFKDIREDREFRDIRNFTIILKLSKLSNFLKLPKFSYMQQAEHLSKLLTFFKVCAERDRE